MHCLFGLIVLILWLAAAPASAQIGACCRTNGTCTIESPPINCGVNFGNVYLGDFTTCQPGVCPAFGACCLSNGSCVLRSQSVCTGTAGATYRGDWTTCTGRTCTTSVRCRFAAPPFNNSCTSGSGSVDLGPGSICADCTGVATGACCFSLGLCSQTTAADCASQQGEFRGPTTVCSTGDQQCPPKGACCLSDGACSFQTQIACTASGGVYWAGAGVDCNNASGPCAGACCSINSVCVVRFRADCLAQPGGGTWNGPGVTCQAANCPTLGACCSGGTCTVVTLSQCPGAGTGPFFFPQVACSPTLCQGACCLSSGACTITNFGGCNGSWSGLASLCVPNNCPEPVGACCAFDGFCSILRGSLCNRPGDSWLGAGTTCSNNPCRLAVCCSISAACSVTRQDQCTGSWLGILPNAPTTCTASPCAAEVGACCFRTTPCYISFRLSCSGGGAQFRGGGTTCSPVDFCYAACCVSAGTSGPDCWTVFTQADCPGTTNFRGFGTTCGTSSCLGACCTPTSSGPTCILTTRSACVTTGTGGWKGPDTTCFIGSPANLVTCCRANFNQLAGVTVQDIFDFLAAYFAGSPSANFNGVGGITVQDIFDFLAAYFAGCS